MPAQTYRDELAGIIRAEYASRNRGDGHRPAPRALAGALLKAGVRPPARVIETKLGIDALPKGAVICGESGRIAEKVEEYAEADNFGFRSAWMEPSEELSYGTDEIDDLPATVLHTPESGDTP